MLLGTDAEDLMVDLLRGGGASSGGVDMENDGFDGGVIAEFAELTVDLFCVEDDAVDVHDGNLIDSQVEGRR